MIRNLIITVFAFLSAVPAFSHTTQYTTTEQAHPALRLMNDSEFATFLENAQPSWLAICKRAASSTFAGVKPKLVRRSLSGAEAPKLCMPMMVPDGPA